MFFGYGFEGLQKRLQVYIIARKQGITSCNQFFQFWYKCFKFKNEKNWLQENEEIKQFPFL